MRRVIVGGGVLLVLVGGAVAGFLALRGQQADGTVPPAAVDPAVAGARASAAADAATLPRAVDPAAARSYLGGPGQDLLSVHAEALAQLGSGSSATTCRERAARLEARVPFLRLSELVEGVPDDPLRELLHAESAALAADLTRCAPGPRPSPEPTDVEATPDLSGADDVPEVSVPPRPGADLGRSAGLVDLRLDALEVIR